MELRGHARVAAILCIFSLFTSFGADIGTGTQSPARKEFSKIIEEQKDAQEKWQDAYKNAKTDEERSKLKYPSSEQYAARVFEVAKKYPNDPAALDALVWIAENCRRGDELEATLFLLLEKYPSEPKLADVIPRLLFARSKETEPFLRAVAEKSSRGDVKGKALLTLGRLLKEQAEPAQFLRTNTEPKSVENYRNWLGDDVVKKLQATDPAELRKEAETFFETVIAKYGKEKGSTRTLGEAAKGELYEMRHLQIGMVAPEIKGADVDGKKFALSDYRGMVVVLDFWGHW